MAGRLWANHPGQVDVGDRALLGAEALSELGKQTAEAVGREDQALPCHHPGSHGDPAIRPLGNPAESTYSMHDSIENQASVYTTLIASSAAFELPARRASPGGAPDSARHGLHAGTRWSS
jgi:hypothetical protein